jgi:hypothetical protein
MRRAGRCPALFLSSLEAAEEPTFGFIVVVVEVRWACTAQGLQRLRHRCVDLVLD